MDNVVVVSGMSGRFPESNNVDECWTNLINGTDMVTEDDRRWPRGYAGLPTRKGTLKTPLDEFDAEFFSINRKQAERLDPRLRLLLEVTWEAIVDSGTNPAELRGRPIGVYVGLSGQETLEASRANLQFITRFDGPGSTGCMFANRISFAFDLRGPSVSLDTFCSSSLFALHVATKAVLEGECDGAIVAGINLLLNPYFSRQIQALGVLAMDGKCKAFDSRGDGYAQSDTVAAVYISKKSLVRRAYATILNTKTNSDGYKENGLTYPSGESQKLLMRQTYKEVGLCPEDVFYVEAHGTGTVAGDTEELGAIDSVFCTNRPASSLPLLVGSTKSNMGHAETASSIAAVIKVLLSFQHGLIPSNLHYEMPNPAVPGLCEGRLKVVTVPTPVTGDLFGICASGIGGTNVHVILKGQKAEALQVSTKLPMLVPFSSRTLDGVDQALKKVDKNLDFETLRLLSQLSLKALSDHKFRGFTLFEHDQRISTTSEITTSTGDTGKRPLWFVFPGMGSQWSGMAKEILKIDTIRNSIEKSAGIMKPYGIDVIDLVVNQSEEGMKKYVSVAFTAIGIALVDFVKSLNLIPDGYLGHSAGEVLCAYQDGCWTAEEALLWQYRKDVILEQQLQGNYGMAAIGLTWDQALTSCPKSIFPACHNAYENVTVGGPLKDLNEFVEELQSQGIFAKVVPTGGKPFHTPYIAKLSTKLESAFDELVKGVRIRSPKWILTGIEDPLQEESIGQFFNTAYIRHQASSPVRFHTAVQKIPENAIVLEIGSHCIFQNIMKKTLPSSVTLIPTMKRDESDNLQRLYMAMGTLFVHGFHPKFTALLSPSDELGIEQNTEKLTSISSLVQAGWDHSQTYPLLDYMPKSGTDAKTKISLDEPEWEFLKGHKIDGRILFPASGYLVLVWKAFASLLRKDMNSFCVKFENVVIHQATVLQQNRFVEFSTSIHESSGNFEISESQILVVSGKIQIFDEDFNQKFVVDSQVNPLQELVLNKHDFYKDLRLRGYGYSGQFVGILHASIPGENAELSWHHEWTSFLDSFLHIRAFVEPLTSTGIYIPTRLRSLTIDPRILTTQNFKSIPVKFCPKTKVLSTIGIRMVDLKLMPAPRRKKVQIEPCFQNWHFEAYFDDSEARLEFLNGLKICVDIVLENVTKPNVTVEEIGTNPSISNAIKDIAKVCFGRLTMTTVENNEPDLVIYSLQNFDDISSFLTKENASFCLFVLSGKSPHENLTFETWTLVAVKITAEDSFYLFRKRNPTKFHEVVIPVDNSNFHWLKPLQMAMSDITPSSRIWLTSTDPDTGLVGFVNCLRKEPGGDVIRCLISPLPELTEEMIQADLVMNVYDVSSRKFGSFRSFNLAHDSYSTSAHAYLNVLNTGDLSSVSWMEASPNYDVSANDTLCTVYYAPLNFRDIMLATGKLSPDALPGEAKKAECVLGLEFSGLDPCGGRIMGVVPAKGLATHVNADPNFIWKVPGKWSLAEAATVPVAYSTAYYALVIRGLLKSHESVLITSGTGGVGQAAIAIALSLNCKVFTTVGSSEKKKWLTTKFPEIKEHHVFSSGTTEFSQKILELTNHRGVDVVLNSLAEEKLQAALLTLGTGGRFLEIGKFDLSQNTSMGMEIFLKNISFHGILVDSLYEHGEKSKNDEKKLLVAIVQEGIDTGVVKPLPSTIFHRDQAQDAFRFMASGRHLGKVVLRMRDDDANSEPDVKVISRTYFHPGKVYVVVGGLGGFGLEFITWLVQRGARNVAILSRTGISNGYQKLQISRWEKVGVKLFFNSTNNFTTIDSMSEFLTTCSKTGGPIGGIFNLAMVLKDALVENQTEENFDLVTRPKYFLTLVLDQASRLTCPELDHFVVFSSVTSVYGNSGQSPYGFGNSAMERLCARRHREGLPGLAIAWGAIGDVGVVHERMHKETVGGTLAQPLTSCLEILDRVLHPKFKEHHGLVSSLVLPNDLNIGNTVNTSGDLKMTLPQKIASILGLSSEMFESKKDIPLGDLGLDSLMVIEVKNVLIEKANLENISSSLIKKLTWTTLNELEVNRKH